jgi:hypothetical protein
MSIFLTVARIFGYGNEVSLRELPKSPMILDIGGEGRHPAAWNLNPRTKKTLFPNRGERIPRLIRGRGESIPLPEHCVDLVIVERTPLQAATLIEIQRVAKAGSFVIFRHADLPWFDPHRIALRMLPGMVHRSILHCNGQTYHETAIQLPIKE